MIFLSIFGRKVHCTDDGKIVQRKDLMVADVGKSILVLRPVLFRQEGVTPGLDQFFDSFL